MKIHKFIFQIGGSHGSGYQIKLIDNVWKYHSVPESYESDVIIDLRRTLSEGKNNEIARKLNSLPGDIMIEPESLEMFSKYIRRYCKHWKKNYKPKHLIIDGTSWYCEICINDFKLISEGNNEFPGNFNTFLLKLMMLTEGKIFY